MNTLGGGASGVGRALRNLANLRASASSWRTLNLVSVWELSGETEAYASAPLFRHPKLNKSIVVKHRIREDETDLFNDGRRTGTKIILPINICDLRSGGRSFIVGQRGYEGVLEELGLRSETSRGDRNVLATLDGLPSLDPFLLRECLRMAGVKPANCYFDISEADVARMLEFTRREIAPLIGISFREVDQSISDKVAKLARKLLSNAGDSELEPLRLGMGMDRAAFEEGIFSWKGFIYYKWCLLDLVPKIKPVADEIAAVRPMRPVTHDESAYIIEARERISKAMLAACRSIRESIKVYEDAYAALTQRGQPTAFRDFLIGAPRLFQDLGERLGAVQHIVSFWRFRVPPGAKVRIQADELVDLLSEFERSLERAEEVSVAA